MEITIEKLTFGGNALGKINGKNVFVPYGIPGETYDIEITDSKKDYDVGKIKSIIKTSSHRVTPPCQYYGKCGGCNMMHIDSEFQKDIRKDILTDIFLQNNIDLKDKITIIHGPNLNYRARFQLNNGGLSEKGSNNIVEVENCLCAENPINDYLKSVPFENRKQGRVHFFGSDYVVKNGQSKDSKLSISIEENKNDKKRIVGKGKTKNLKLKENKYFAGTVASPENAITVQLNGKDITFDVRGFFQSNLFVFEKVIKLITDILPGGKKILDMYAGCGSISTFLADKYDMTVLVEHNRDAIVYAEQNLMGKAHISYGVSGETWVKDFSKSYTGEEGFDACVVDPPRSGMEKEVRNYLCNSNIPLILSMSCDPSTNARDCASLIKSGYVLKQMYLLDFYPNTSHIESLGVFELNK